MMNQQTKREFKIPALVFILLSIVLSGGYGCHKGESRELYHKFPDKAWHRFNVLSFEITIGNVEKPYDIYMFARVTSEFQYEKLGFNMVMNTPAGEERINEYQMEVKSKSGAFLGELRNDSCEGVIMLKKELNLSKPGVLKIEIENLTPRLITRGILGVGIRMVQSGK